MYSTPAKLIVFICMKPLTSENSTNFFQRQVLYECFCFSSQNDRRHDGDVGAPHDALGHAPRVPAF